jgi:DNA polymerase I
MTDTLYVIDVSSFIFRAYHSVGHLSTADGTPTGAVYGVANMLVSLFTEHRPTHVAVAMDSRTPTFRKDIFPAYKANRPPPPDDLKVQFPLVREVIEAFDLEVLQKDGFEADDLIATATRAALEAGLAVVIVSGDKDLMQLVGPRVVVLDTMKGVTYDPAAVEAKWGVPPALIGDLLALTGDSSDNIPGVPRVGPKTAVALLREHGDLEALLADPGAVRQKAVAANLAGHVEDARLSRRLVALDDEVPVELSFDRMRHGPPDPAKLSPVLDRLELRRLKERLFGAAGTAAIAPEQGERPTYETVSELRALEDAAREIRAAGRFAVDLETTSVSPTTRASWASRSRGGPCTPCTCPWPTRKARACRRPTCCGCSAPCSRTRRSASWRRTSSSRTRSSAATGCASRTWPSTPCWPRTWCAARGARTGSRHSAPRSSGAP